MFISQQRPLKQALIAVWILCFGTAFSQVSENFSDGNLNSNPVWVGDTALFKVDVLSQLQLWDTSSTKSSSFISTPSKAISNASWEFFFKLDFAPSSSNYGAFYLTSDKKDLSGSLEGYFVRIGGQTSTIDDIGLYKQSGTTKTRLTTGRQGVVATNPRGWIKVTRDSLGNWEVFSDTSVSKTGYISEGTVLNTDIISSEYVGPVCFYTATRDSLFYFDDITITGSFYSDTTKPVVAKSVALSKNMIQIEFSEKIDPVSGLDTTNYRLFNQLGKGLIDSALAYNGLDSSQVILYLKDTLGELPNNFLYIHNVLDRNGNKSDTSIQRIVWELFSQPSSKDVLINEIMCDPNPPVALPNTDWVELYNRSSKTFELLNWEFSDASSTGQVKLPSYSFRPGEHLIICHQSDSADLASYGKVLSLSKFPALNTDDEVLTLKDSTGKIIDQVYYFKSWYGSSEKSDGGFTLELINPNHPCPGSDNWRASESLDGGTPGQINSIYNTTLPTDEPKVIQIEVLGDTAIIVHLSRALEKAELISGTYSFSPTLTPSKVEVLSDFSEQVKMVFNPKMAKGIIYELTIFGMKDCFGNSVNSSPTPFGIGSTPSKFDILITEIFSDPDQTITKLPEYEFLELYNTSNRLISLQGCLLSDKSTYSQLGNIVMQPNEYIILCEQKATAEFESYGKVFGVSSWPSLNNAGDDISLSLPDSTQIHKVSYSDDWHTDIDKKKGGWSLEMVDTENPCEEGGNWKSSNNNNGGTPGQENSVKESNPDITTPELVAAIALNDTTLLVHFNENISSTIISEVRISINPFLIIKEVSFFSEKSLMVLLGAKLKTRTIYEFAISGVTDCSGNVTSKQIKMFGLPEIGENSDVVINEVLFNPKTGNSSDYVELYNRSEKVIDLKGWQICSYDVLKDSLSGCKEMSAQENTLLPREFKLLSKSNDEIRSTYPTNDSKTFIELAALPTYSNDEGVVIILNDSGTIIDRFDYREDMHNALIKDPDGVALERLDYNRKTNDMTNWHSAAQPVGFGTPGLPNSQFIQATDFSTMVTLEPQTFSPDNDGFEDVLNINYSFDQPGYVASITIFDAEGRNIKELIKSELLETEGTISWDGSTERGIRANTGIYVVFFDVYHPDGRVQQFKKAAVIAVKF